MSLHDERGRAAEYRGRTDAVEQWDRHDGRTVAVALDSEYVIPLAVLRIAVGELVA